MFLVGMAGRKRETIARRSSVGVLILGVIVDKGWIAARFECKLDEALEDFR